MRAIAVMAALILATTITSAYYDGDQWISLINQTPHIISNPLEKAYPGIEYNIRIGVIGGKYPYTYGLVAGPQGMQIDSGRGEISWTPSLEGETAFSVNVTDSLGQSIQKGFIVNVTHDSFYFVDDDGDDASGNGSLANPWQTIQHANSNIGDIDSTVIVRQGYYLVEEGMEIREIRDSPRRWIAYPGEEAIIDLNSSGSFQVQLEEVYFQGFEFRNAYGPMFNVWTTDRSVWRDNEFYNLTVSGSNCGFINMGDGGSNHTDNIFQDNVMSETRGDPNQVAGLITFNAKRLLFEDNNVSGSDSRCVGDKDNGFYNTYRGNIVHDCRSAGIRIENQHGSSDIEIHHNILYDISGGAITVGGQPQWVENVDIHHNTINGSASFNVPISGPVWFHDNILMSGGDEPYLVSDCSFDDSQIMPYLLINNNLVHTSSGYLRRTSGYWNTTSCWDSEGNAGWRTVYANRSQWHASGKDNDSLFTDPLLSDPADRDYTPLEASPACGAGSLGEDIGANPCSTCGDGTCSDDENCSLCPEDCGRCVFFNDSFETGDLSHTENGANWMGSGSVTVSQEQAHTGDYSLRFFYSGNPDPDTDASSEQRFDLGSDINETYIRFYIRFPENYAHRDPGPSNNKLIRLWSDNADYSGCTIKLGASFNPAVSGISRVYPEGYHNGWPDHALDYEGGMGGINYEANFGNSTGSWEITEEDLGRWICMEFHFRKEEQGGDAAYELWVDGEKILGKEGLSYLNGPPPYDHFRTGYLMGWANSGFDEDTYIHVDDVVFSKSYVGPMDDYHDADTDRDGAISTSEIKAFIHAWKSGNADIDALMSGIFAWKG